MKDANSLNEQFLYPEKTKKIFIKFQ